MTTVAAKPAKSKEYFSEKDYGVKASPRVVNVALATLPGAKFKRLPRGGGRDQLGKPYKIKGKWYVPQEDPNYRAQGIASWYGDAFHGRLTANGEIYDMNHLSAAHPTMPLPSYARVTNKANGHSLIVRVNDRGPYAHGRVIDLSRRAAELLDYTHKGTAQVVVEYVGRAPVDGADDEYLMASYRPGTDGAPVQAQSDVMVAMAGDVLPGVGQGSELALAGTQVPIPRSATAAAKLEPYDPFTGEATAVLPTSGPLPDSRPSACGDLLRCDTGTQDVLVSGYASERVEASHRQANAFDVMRLDESILRNWKENAGKEQILVGVFDTVPLEQLKRAAGKSASIQIRPDSDGTTTVMIEARTGKAADVVLKRLWKAGFNEAFVLH